MVGKVPDQTNAIPQIGILGVGFPRETPDNGFLLKTQAESLGAFPGM
jgi:hypothetical protein